MEEEGFGGERGGERRRLLEGSPLSPHPSHACILLLLSELSRHNLKLSPQGRKKLLCLLLERVVVFEREGGRLSDEEDSCNS